MRPVLFLLALLIISYTDAGAQLSNDYIRNFSIDLDEVSAYYDETIRRSPLDTLGVGRVDRLRLGSHHFVTNPLYNVLPRNEFDRTEEVTEYTLGGDYKFTFTHPKIARFTYEEERQGSFIVFQPRDLSLVATRVITLDALAEQQRVSSLNSVWRETVIATINSQQVKAQTSRGLLNIKIPVDMPDAVERIIGQGEATNINISGRESITFAGETRRVSPFIGVEGQQSQPLFPSLDMQQELDVRLNGQIGEKVNIQVDHSSQAISTDQNRIRLNYTGFEDDIIQLIELGNTSLSLPGSQLVSFSGGSQGLFGIKALAQVGALDLTMIASKEEGEASRSTFTPSGGQIGQTESRIIADISFIKNVYFFLDRPDSSFMVAPDSFVNPVFFPPDPERIEIWRSVADGLVGIENLNVKRGRAFLDQSGRGDDIREGLDSLAVGGDWPFVGPRNFKLLTFPTDYRYVINSLDDGIIGIELVNGVPENEILGVRYVNSLGDTIGDLGNDVGSTSNPINLELIKNANQKPDDADFGPAWRYMMRHIYNLGLTNIDRNTLEVQILENTIRQDPSRPAGASLPWLRIFGLDQTDETGIGPPDDRIDLGTGVIDLQRGILTFPILRAFDPRDALVELWTGGEFAFDSIYAGLRNPAIYDNFLTVPQDNQRFSIQVTASSTSSSFSINAFNITENSETITVDGRTLVRNQDYTIDYDTGEVELQGEILDALTPTSNITVDYEFTPLAGAGSTTLAGINADYKFGDNATLGTTWLYESTASSTEKPRLGEEPTRAIVGDTRGNFKANPRFFTNLVNALPLVDTDAASTLQLSGELAISMPDPNTRGEVYIDDFEGIEDSDVFSLSRRVWKPASPPVDEDDDLLATLDPAKAENIIWYNIEPEQGVNRRDLNPDLDEREATLVPTIDFEFDTVTVDSTNWAGVMQGFRGAGLDLTQGQFIEIWVNDFKPNQVDRGGKIHIDLGFIDEDFHNPDADTLNTEDADFIGFNALTEDTGLDNVFGEDDANVAGDDGDDDFEVQRIGGRFEKINGTENNRILDTEDLDGSGAMEETNAYWTLDVDLAADAESDIRRDFPGYSDFNHPDESWRRYRIDLSQIRLVAPDGTPLINQIQHMRVWVDEIPAVVNPSVKRLQIAGFKVVGNRWQQDGVRDLQDQAKTPTSAQVALGVISTKTDPTRYVPPINPNQVNDIVDKEQSLLITYTDLDSLEAFRIRKRFSGRGLDFTNYRDLNFFVHVDTFSADIEYYFRVAFDSLNYYEINLPMTQAYFPASSSNWARVLVTMADISDLKFEPRDSVVVGRIQDGANPDLSYEVKMVGTPSLFNVRFLFAGVRNKGPTRTLGIREVWVNDIYLGDRKRDIDTAARVNGTLNMGNVINLSGSWRRTGPDFRGLRQDRGTGVERTSLALSAKTAVQHFIPTMGFRIPLAGNFARDLSLPKFTPSSDTEIDDPAIADSLRTETVNRGFTATLTRAGSKNPLFRYTFDRLKLNYSMSQSQRRTPTARDTSLSVSGTADYSITWGQKTRIKLFKNVQWRWWLNSFNFRVTANRNTGENWTLVGDKFERRPSRFASRINANGSMSYIPFPSLSASFRASQQRDRALKQLVNGVNIGREINRNQSFQTTYKPPPIWLIGAFSPDISFNTSYREDSSPNVRRPGDPVTVRNVNNARDTNVKMRFDLGRYLKKIFGAINLIEEEPQQTPPSTPAPGGAGAGTAQPDSAQVEEPKRRVDPFIALKKVTTALGNIRRINISGRQQFRSQYDRIPERPSLPFQFALTEDSGVYTAEGKLDEPLSKNNSLAITLDSGTQITRNLDLAVRFSRTQDDTESRGTQRETRSYIWPDLNFSWKGLEKWPMFRRFAVTSTATMSYRQTSRESGQAGQVDQKTDDRQINPALVFGWKNGMSTSVSAQFNRNSSDVRGSITETTNSTYSADLKYSFSAGKTFKLPIPGLRNKVLKSKLDSSVNMSYSRRGGKRGTGGSLEFFEPIPATTSFRLAPRLTYNFTRALNGSFFVDYNRTFSEATNQTTTIVRIGLNATFTF